MQDEVGAGQQGGLQGVGALESGLGIGDLGCREGAAAAIGQPEAPGELACAVHHQGPFRGAEGGCPGLHGDGA